MIQTRSAGGVAVDEEVAAVEMLAVAAMKAAVTAMKAAVAAMKAAVAAEAVTKVGAEEMAGVALSVRTVEEIDEMEER